MWRAVFALLPVVAAGPARAADPLAVDAAAYAAQVGVGEAEALSRLRAIEESHAATDALARRYAGRLAGISVVHAPDLRLRVLLTGTRNVRADRFTARDGRVVPIEFVNGAAATRQALVLAIRAHGDALAKAIPGGRGLGVDPRRGEVRLYLAKAPDDHAARAPLEAKASSILGVPVRISPADTRVFNFSVPVAGGGRVIGADASGKRFACTTGFLVTDGAQTAVTTAAHCPDELSYAAADGSSLALPYLNQWGARAYDVQLNRLDGPGSASFFANRKAGERRAVATWRNRASIRAGDWLCHWGEKSGYACAEVELTDYAPPGALCAGTCEPLFTTLAGPNCGAGDSGGPIFIGTTAVGLIKGGSKASDLVGCNFSYFQSVDYLPPGWKLLLADASSLRRGIDGN